MNHLGTKTLETSRLILRKFQLDDALKLYTNLYSDSKVNRFLSWNVHRNVQETSDFIKEWINNYKEDVYNWVIIDKTSNEPIGSLEVVGIQAKHMICEVGYQLGSCVWSKGYGTEILKTVCDFLLNEVGFFMIEAKVRAENIGSIRVCEKAGMKLDAILPKRRVDKFDGHRDDLYIYSLNREDF